MNMLPSALRSLTKSPRYTLLAVSIIALGTGACSAIFCLYDSTMLAPRAGIVAEAELVDIGRTQNGAGFDNFSVPDFTDYREQNSTFVDMAGTDYSPSPAGLSVGGMAENANLQWVSPNYFGVLGTRLVKGRSFTDDRNPHAEVIISHRYWQRRFQSDPNVIGRDVLLNNVPATVIGVTEPGFTGNTMLVVDFWAPFPFFARIDPESSALTRRGSSFIIALGRLKPGVSIPQAQDDLSRIARRNAELYPETHRERGVAVMPSGRFPGEIRQMATVFMGVLGLLVLLAFLVASANIASLMLARSAIRQREFAVRSALGADRSRLVRSLLLEHLTLFVLGGLGGTLVCLWILDLLKALVPALPVNLELNVQLNPLTVAFTLLLALLIGLGFSLGPALSAARFDLLTVLRQGEQPMGSTRIFGLRGLFLVIQLTLSLALLVTAATLTQSLWRLAHRDPGFDARRVEFIQIDLSTAGMNEPAGRQFLDRLLLEAARLPTVEHAALTVAIPLDGTGYGFGGLSLPGATETDADIRTDWNLISPDYFATMGIPLLQGRAFTANDREGSPLVGIVNETLARRLWPHESAIGRTLLNEDNKPVEIIGVARDAKYRSAGELPRNHFYAPIAQLYFRRPGLMVKTRDDISVIPQLRKLVHQLQPSLPVYHAQSLTAATAASLMPQRIAASAALATGLLTLLLAATGVYGVTLYWTSTRTREFGVRLALGATPRSLVSLALSGCLRLSMVAILLGLVAAHGLTLLINSLFGGIVASPLVYATAALGFALLVIFAAWLPARRSARVDPMIALRAE
ncbi:MAG: ABC transporter permease [Cephaloticoccus sp.]|nr:ABC transporter permease [Cephaloticoccus sp.]MCF7760679.1 ABC transporter permease [Cephaloticoccus sp.]